MAWTGEQLFVDCVWAARNTQKKQFPYLKFGLEGGQLYVLTCRCAPTRAFRDSAARLPRPVARGPHADDE